MTALTPDEAFARLTKKFPHATPEWRGRAETFVNSLGQAGLVVVDATDSPNETICPHTNGAGFYCDLPQDHEGEHQGYWWDPTSNGGKTREEARRVAKAQREMAGGSPGGSGTVTQETSADEWSIQEVPQEGAPFLLYRGVLVGRLYGGCPYSLMLRLLNGEDRAQ